MKRRLVHLIAGVLALILLIFIVLSFNRTSQQISQRQLALDPSQASTPPEASPSAHSWQQFYDLSFTGANLIPTTLAFDGQQNLALLDVPSQKLLILDQSNKNFSLLELPPSSVPAAALTYGEQNLYLFAGALYLYQPAERTWTKLTPDFTFPAPVSRLEKFGDNFYLFSPNMINKINLDKHRQYLGLEAWLDSSQNLSFTPLDVYLDGHIYVSDTSGKVTRFLRGTATNWQPKTELFGPQYLAGSDDELFYLSPSQQKIFVVAPGGALLREYADPLLAQAQFLWYSPEPSTFYTLSGSALYFFTPPEIDPV